MKQEGPREKQFLLELKHPQRFASVHFAPDELTPAHWLLFLLSPYVVETPIKFTLCQGANLEDDVLHIPMPN